MYSYNLSSLTFPKFCCRLKENDRVFKQLLAQFVENEGSQIYLVQRKRDRLQAYLYWLRDDLLKLTSP